MENPIPSPCTNVCSIDKVSGLCAGCGRSLSEIASWGTMTQAARLAVMARLLAARLR